MDGKPHLVRRLVHNRQVFVEDQRGRVTVQQIQTVEVERGEAPERLELSLLQLPARAA